MRFGRASVADIRRDLERFLRQQLFRNREQPLTCFSLRSAGVGSKGSAVDTFEIPDGFSGDHVGILVDEILMRAQADADGLGSKLQRYILIALEVSKKDGPRFPFRLRGEGEDDTDEGEEPPNEKGLLAQMMRHNEALMRMNTMAMGGVMTTLAKRLEAAEKFNEVLIAQRHSYLESLENAKSLQHDRDMEALQISGHEDRKAELFKKLEMILPLVINKVTGRKLLPEGTGGDVFSTLANSLTPEQLQAIAPYLTQEQQMMFLTLLKSARDASEKQNGVS